MLQPTLSLILGNLRYESHVIACDAALGLLPHINHAMVALPARVEIEAGVGDNATLAMVSDGDMTSILTGKISRIERQFAITEVQLVDGGQKLAQTRIAATYEGQDGGTVIRNLARDAGVETGTIDAELPLVNYVAHQNATAAEHVARIATLSGCIAHFGDDGRLNVVARPAGQPDLALLYGREFLRYAAREVAPPLDQLVLVGNGPAGNPAEPGAARPSATRLPASAPDPGPTARHVPVPLLKTPTAAVAAGQAANIARAATTRELTAYCFLLPQIRPGQVVQVQSLPTGVPEGPWLVARVRHTLGSQRAGQTILHAEVADLAGLGLDALLGAALSLGAGLL